MPSQMGGRCYEQSDIAQLVTFWGILWLLKTYQLPSKSETFPGLSQKVENSHVGAAVDGDCHLPNQEVLYL